MLVLTVKESEYLMIGDDIKIQFDTVSGNSIRIGIAAPKSVPVVRDKVYAQKLAGYAEDEEKTPEEIERAEELLRQHRKEKAKKRADKYRNLAQQRRDEERRLAKQAVGS